MEEAVAERFFRFELPKSCKEEVSLLERLKPKPAQYKDKWAADVFRNWQAAYEKKFLLLELSQRVCSKIMMFTTCKFLEKGWKT